MRFKFKCPKCEHKKLSERYERATIVRKILEVDFMDSTADTTEGDLPHTYYRVYGEDAISDEKVHKWTCNYHTCDFVLPVRNAAELIEWLYFHDMLLMSLWDANKWPTSRAKLINAGEISRELLEALYGSTYVPPSEETLIAQLFDKRAAKV